MAESHTGFAKCRMSLLDVVSNGFSFAKAPSCSVLSGFIALVVSEVDEFPQVLSCRRRRNIQQMALGAVRMSHFTSNSPECSGKRQLQVPNISHRSKRGAGDDNP